MTPEEEYGESLNEWKKAVDKIIRTTETTRKLLGMATDNLKLFLSDLESFRRRNEVAKSRAMSNNK